MSKVSDSSPPPTGKDGTIERPSLPQLANPGNNHHGRKIKPRPRSRAREAFLLWLYAYTVNPEDRLDLAWLSHNMEVKVNRIDAEYFDSLIKFYTENQKVIDKTSNDYISREYPTLDYLCKLILRLVIVEKGLSPRLAKAIVINESVGLARSYSPEGYPVVNALAEKLWKYDL